MTATQIILESTRLFSMLSALTHGAVNKKLRKFDPRISRLVAIFRQPHANPRSAENYRYMGKKHPHQATDS
jgi:hypothetical protein